MAGLYIEMEHGVFFDDAAVRNATTHAVVGHKIIEELALPENPVGEVIRILNVPFVIIGSMKERGESGMGANIDDSVVIPRSTQVKRVLGSRFPDSVPSITLRLYEDADNAIVIEQITSLLRQRHRIKDGDVDDFQITDMKQIMETMNTVAGFLRMLLIAIASVSLLVGSIGIMNMMLVSVAERTREIGIRKAIGAREIHIIIQFLSESVMISFIGSMIGFILGLVLSQTVLPGLMDMDVPLSISSVFLSIGVAGVVGIASGVVPARKAAGLFASRVQPCQCVHLGRASHSFQRGGQGIPARHSRRAGLESRHGRAPEAFSLQFAGYFALAGSVHPEGAGGRPGDGPKIAGISGPCSRREPRP